MQRVVNISQRSTLPNRTRQSQRLLRCWQSRLLGCATCWIGAFLPEKVAAAMQLPPGLKPLAILPIGYGDEQPERTSRRALGEFVHEL